MKAGRIVMTANDNRCWDQAYEEPWGGDHYACGTSCWLESDDFPTKPRFDAFPTGFNHHSSPKPQPAPDFRPVFEYRIMRASRCKGLE